MRVGSIMYIKYTGLPRPATSLVSGRCTNVLDLSLPFPLSTYSLPTPYLPPTYFLSPQHRSYSPSRLRYRTRYGA
jgi:hypothetical protein